MYRYVCMMLIKNFLCGVFGRLPWPLKQISVQNISAISDYSPNFLARRRKTRVR